MTDQRDECPTCGVDLTRQAFKADLGAGDFVICGGCDDEFEIAEFDDGTETWMIFTRVES